MNRKRTLYAVLCLAFCITLNTACNQENMSKVTINFGEIPLAKAEQQPGFLERLYAFFLPSAHAEWAANYNLINLTITGDGMEDISVNVPPGSTSITVEVPMGEGRLFTIFAYQGAAKNWGGHVLANTNDSEVSVSMNVYPIVTGLYVYDNDGAPGVEWNRVLGVSGYHIYRSTSILGPYTLVHDYVGDGEGEPVPLHWRNNTYPGRGTYYYYVSVYYSKVEGEPCDPGMVYMPD